MIALMIADILIVGAGPAGLALAAALCDAGLHVAGLAPAPPDAPWPNTYGIWEDELSTPTLAAMLKHRWTDCTVYAGGETLPLARVYGLLDNASLQAHWRYAPARSIEHRAHHSTVTTGDGGEVHARLVIDATGHAPAFVKRPAARGDIAYQAAYGVVGTFAQPPVRSGQLVLMDYRAEHLTEQERRTGPPTFLYAMDLGEGRYFVEETSLARAPAVPFDQLKQRLARRLQYMGRAVATVEHEEFCLFPMNMPVPDLTQPVLGYGGAASMVHPASGYQVGAALRNAPVVARALAQALATPDATPVQVAKAGWDALWPAERLRKHRLYLFGLQTLLSFDEARLQRFFAAFFHLPRRYWGGYLSNTLALSEIVYSMTSLFLRAPMDVRGGLMAAALRHPGMFGSAVSGWGY
jgi:lycopene beta-cyclase